MSTRITQILTNYVYDYFKTKKYFVGFEVANPIKRGRVDVGCFNNKDISICIEVKSCKGDMRSKHGHNFFGNYNYYAIPEEIVDYAIERVPDGIGIITLREKRLIIDYKQCIDYEIEIIRKPLYYPIEKQITEAIKNNVFKSINFSLSNYVRNRISKFVKYGRIDL